MFNSKLKDCNFETSLFTIANYSTNINFLINFIETSIRNSLFCDLVLRKIYALIKKAI